MTEYLRPGAYTERVDAAQSNQLLLRSDVPAFVGIAEKGPLDKPVPVESFRQFQAHFGGFIKAGYLAFSVRAFFDNGGRRCWIVRVAARSFGSEYGAQARTARFQVNDTQGVAVWSIQASSEGSWGNKLEVALSEEHHGDTSIAPGGISPFYAQVNCTAGFERGSLVLISQDDFTGGVENFIRVISFVDEQQHRLYWQHPQPGQGLVYDQVLTEVDVNRPARISSVTYRLLVKSQSRLIASYSQLSLIPEHQNYGPTLLVSYQAGLQNKFDDQIAKVPDSIAIVPLQTSYTTIPNRLNVNGLELNRLSQGQDGLSILSQQDFIGEDFSQQDSDSQQLKKNRGIETLNQVDEVTLLAVPDIVIQPQAEVVYTPLDSPQFNPCVSCPPAAELKRKFLIPSRGIESPPEFSDEQIFQVQAAMVSHCEVRGDRFAVIDPPYHIANNVRSGIAEIQAWRNRFDSHYAAIYYPWLKVIDPDAIGTVRMIPPSGHVLGQYASLDNEIGVHRAPANRALQWTQDLSLHTTYGQQEILNPMGINVLRSEKARGIRIMGARTVSADPDWRYINVRRLMIMIRRSLNIISQWVVFEPNNVTTRNKFQVAISSYLIALWGRGALTGELQEQAFFVKCDEENNPDYQRNNGQLVAEIGVAPSIPFEFVILRVGLQGNELNISEIMGVASVA